MLNTRSFLRFLVIDTEKIGEDDLDKNAVACLQKQLEKNTQGN